MKYGPGLVALAAAVALVLCLIAEIRHSPALIPAGVPVLAVCEQLAPDECRAVLDIRQGELERCMGVLGACVETSQRCLDRAVEAEATRP